MTTVMPHGEEVKKAVKWVSEQRQENQGANLNKLVEEASERFNLSPKDGDFLLRLVKEEQTDG